MLHEAQEERQVIGGHALFVEREKEGAFLGMDQIIGVLDALGDALVGEQRAQIVAGNECGQIVVGDFGIDGHAASAS